MVIFDKIYNCYYQIVSQILLEAANHPIHQSRMQELCDQYGFLESGIAIIPKLLDGTWPLLMPGDAGGYDPTLKVLAPLPLTALQKAWLKALLLDIRLQLFFTADELQQLKTSLSETTALYRPTDFYYFDQYLDGDPFEDPSYQQYFRQLFSSLKQGNSVFLHYHSPKKGVFELEFLPCQIQYSNKDHKFRMQGIRITKQKPNGLMTINLARIKKLWLGDSYPNQAAYFSALLAAKKVKEPVLIEISGKRNSLERCMIQFSSYQKKTVYDETHDRYLCSIYYDTEEETDLLIQLLSFGPVIRVLKPQAFLTQFKDRIKKQQECFFPHQTDYV